MIEIADVHEEQLDEIEELEGRCFSVPWKREMLQSQLGEGHIFLAANTDGRVAGYVGMMTVLDEGYISNVAVAPEMRRRGIADTLLRELERRARKMELSFMTLEVRQSNAPAIALYEKHGFSRVGVRRGYYEQPREDAVLMTLKFT